MKSLALFLCTAALLLADHKKIVVVGMDPDAIRDFQSVSPEVTVVSADRGTILNQVADADAIFGTITPDLFKADKKLKWVQIYSAGVETYRFPEFIHSNVT